MSPTPADIEGLETQVARVSRRDMPMWLANEDERTGQKQAEEGKREEDRRTGL